MGLCYLDSARHIPVEVSVSYTSAEVKLRALALANATLQADLGTNPFRWLGHGRNLSTLHEGLQNSASTAKSTAIFPEYGIGLVVFMGAWAMRYLGMMISASAKIFSVGYGLQVLRIAASWVAAEMIQLQAFRNWAHVNLISGAMGQDVFSRASYFNQSVSGASCSAHPQPATAVRLRGDVQFKTLLNWQSVKILISHVISFGSRWSGLHVFTRDVAARSYFPTFAAERATCLM